MRKSLVALALACAFPAAFAQQSINPAAALPGPIPAPDRTSVTLYGLVDVGVEHVDAGDLAETRVQSGMLAGSRLGIRGVESLGNGYEAVFTLENRLEADTGRVTNNNILYSCRPYGSTVTPSCPGVTSIGLPPSAALVGGLNTLNATLLEAVTTVNSAGALFDRQAFAGLVTPYGAILAGRLYTPGYEIVNKFNSFADASAGQFGQGFSTLQIRTNNALVYRAEAKGFALTLMYGFGGSEANRSERIAAPGKGDDFMGANFFWEGDVFGAGIGYNRNNVVPYATQAAGTPESREGLTTLNVGGSAKVGAFKFFLQYMKRRDDNPIITANDLQNLIVSGNPNIVGVVGALQISPFDVDTIRGVVGKTDTQIYHLGATWRIGSGTVIGAYNHAKDDARSAWQTGDASVDHYAVSYVYDLSRRTSLYGVYAYADNKGQARVALGAAGYAGGWTTAPGTNSSAIQAGIRHTF